jgi:hypothetical protein
MAEHVLDDAEIPSLPAKLNGERVSSAMHVHPALDVLLDETGVAEEVVPPAMRGLAIHALLRFRPRHGVLVPSLRIEEVVVRLGGDQCRRSCIPDG